MCNASTVIILMSTVGSRYRSDERAAAAWSTKSAGKDLSARCGKQSKLISGFSQGCDLKWSRTCLFSTIRRTGVRNSTVYRLHYFETEKYRPRQQLGRSIVTRTLHTETRKRLNTGNSMLTLADVVQNHYKHKRSQPLSHKDTESRNTSISI